MRIIKVALIAIVGLVGSFLAFLSSYKVLVWYALSFAALLFITIKIINKGAKSRIEAFG